MNQQGDKQLFENFTNSITAIVEHMDKNLLAEMQKLPKEEQEKIAKEMKNVDIKGKTDELKKEFSSLKDILERL